MTLEEKMDYYEKHSPDSWRRFRLELITDSRLQEGLEFMSDDKFYAFFGSGEVDEGLLYGDLMVYYLQSTWKKRSKMRRD